jgi:beta-lactamase class A
MKQFLLLILTTVFAFTTFANIPPMKLSASQKQLKALEKEFDGKIGVYAINTNNGDVIAYRDSERFPVQSTMKLMAVAALFQQSGNDDNLLQENITYTKDDLVYWHPITGQHIATGMTLEALAEAAMSYSDNTAANLIIKKVGGPQAITAFAQSMGNASFNVEHYEGSLNSNPNDKQDTSTPKDMAISLEKLTVGHQLTPSQQTLLMAWMRNNTTAYKRIRAGVPYGWTVADKTGTGDYGIANDIGIIGSPFCKPIVLSIYTVRNKPDAKVREDIVASATNIVSTAFSKNDKCFSEM